MRGIEAVDLLELRVVPEQQVVVFSKTTCPFCRKTKDLFDGLDVKYTAVELGDFNPHPKP